MLLGRIPGLPRQEVLWDGAAAAEDAEFGPTRPVNGLVAAIREEARTQAATALYERVDRTAVGADAAWSDLGLWVPSDSAAHAVRQARTYLGGRTRVQALWAGPSGSFPKPLWVCVDVTEVHAHSTGPRNDVPWLQVWDGLSLSGMQLSDLALVRRAADGDSLTRPEQT
ncbi:hypothetical protein ACFVZ3_06610 [Kitasatospora purpeofusca]|uniref:hypothetical protein n=1 Tax=Kitasatospora purpeofusca TaxID=67352 RepID=UPI0036853B0A